MIKVLTGNDLGKLGNVETLPSAEEIKEFVQNNAEISEVLANNSDETIHQKAKVYLEKNDPATAWKILLANKM